MATVYNAERTELENCKLNEENYSG